ncbi:MAG: hypothetical protein JST80_06270 [Bdellovibrionales bacterium]|nr:hypothetical protein [Bdellovibrionales bacterium]
MKNTWILTQVVVILFTLGSAQATEQALFDKYPAVKTVPTCKDVDFSSYFRAQETKSYLMRDNPDRSKPNYGGKYLLLKQELLMERNWLIVDCETGKIFHERLTGDAEFKPNSLFIVMTKPKSRDPIEYHVWSGGEWSKVDVAPAADSKAMAPKAEPVKAAAAEKPVILSEQYAPLFGKYPAKVEFGCKDIDYNSFFRAQGNKNNIIAANPNRGEPNFAGHYLLLRSDVLFERMWLIVDCQTGKFLSDIVKDNIEFKPDSYLVLIKHTSDFARLQVWRDNRYVEILNPIRTGKQVVENKIYDQEAKDLVKAVGGTGRESKITFEDLRCVAQNCTTKLFSDKAPRSLTEEQSRLAESILKRWGGESTTEGSNVAFSIEEGKCTSQRNNPTCEIKLTR